MVVGCTRPLPRPTEWVSTSVEGAVPGSISRTGSLKAEPIDRPMVEDDSFGVISPTGALLAAGVMDYPAGVERAPYLRTRWAWPRGEVDETGAERVERARAAVFVHVLDPGDDVVAAARYAYRLGDRIAALADGCVNDFFARRFFAPGGWEVPGADPQFDALEHVSLYAEPLHDGLWLRTHGLVKFGRPEMEIYRVKREMSSRAIETIGTFVDHVVRDRPIAPGHTLGNPSRPLLAQPGRRHPDYWEGMPVLELVDVDRKGEPFPSGANHGLAAMIWA